MSQMVNKPSSTRSRPVVSWLASHFIQLLTVLALLIYMFTYLEGSFGRPIRSDGAGYYAYLPSYLIYGDPSFERDAEVRYGGEFPRWTYVHRLPDTGRYLNTYNIGVAILTAPFFLMAHGVTWMMQSLPGGPEWLAFNYPLDGYSLFYQHAAGLAGLFYFICAMAILKTLLTRTFGETAAVFSLTSVILGTNLLNYGSGETVLSHPSTLFLFAVLLWVTPQWYRAPRSRKWILLLGLTLAGLYLTRPLNILFFLVVPLYGLCSIQQLQERFIFAIRNLKALVAVAGLCLIGIVPQLLVWFYASGQVYINAYREHYGWTAPQLYVFLVSVYKGMFFWFPITAMAGIGFWALFRVGKEWFWAVTASTVVFVLTVSSYFMWTDAGGFGNRYIVDISPLLMFPLAALWASISSPKTKWVMLALASLCILWTLFLMKLYYTREIGFYGLDTNALFDIFWWRKTYLLEWFGNR